MRDPVVRLTASTVVLPFATRPSDGFRLAAAARDLSAALRITRSAAIARHREMVLDIDVARRTFGSPAVRERSIAADIAIALTFAGVEQAARTRGGFRFFPDGSSTGGDVTLRLADRTAAICVDWLTGLAGQDRDCVAKAR